MYNIIIIIEIGGIATALRWSDSDTLTRNFFLPSPNFLFYFFLCGEFIKKRYLRIVDIISFSFILFFPGWWIHYLQCLQSNNQYLLKEKKKSNVLLDGNLFYYNSDVSPLPDTPPSVLM